MQVLYLGGAPRTKETLPDFHEKCRVTRHSRVFCGLTGSQRTPGVWDVTVIFPCELSKLHIMRLQPYCSTIALKLEGRISFLMVRGIS